MRFTLDVEPPFRLDRTVAVLQRLPSNPIDVWTGGTYVRAFEGAARPAICRVAQGGPSGGSPVALHVEVEGDAGGATPWRSRLRRMLGLDVDLAPFYALARCTPEIAPLVPLVTGVRPPRFASLHEAFAEVILFQQVSLAAGVATLRRLVEALSPPIAARETTLHAFPSAARLAGATPGLLRKAGLSGNKARALRGAAAAVASGALRDEDLEPMSTQAVVDRLQELSGVGPWTASLLALRYLGRLDVFPPGDVAATKALGDAGGPALVERLGPYRGMLYYLLFMRRRALAGAAPWASGPAA